MKFWREDTRIIKRTDPRDLPVDRNDPDGAKEAIELAFPDGLNWKAKETLNYLDGTAVCYEYKGKLVVTDESLELTAYGDGIHEAIGFPRGEFDTWEELEAWLTDCYDNEREYWYPEN